MKALFYLTLGLLLTGSSILANTKSSFSQRLPPKPISLETPTFQTPKIVAPSYTTNSSVRSSSTATSGLTSKAPEIVTVSYQHASNQQGNQ